MRQVTSPQLNNIRTTMKGKKVLLVHPITVKGILYKEVAEMAGAVALQIQVGEVEVARSTPSRTSRTTSSERPTTTWEEANEIIHLRRRRKQSSQPCTTVEAHLAPSKVMYRLKSRSASYEDYHLNNKSVKRTTWCNRIGLYHLDHMTTLTHLSSHVCKWQRLEA